jgi:predicted nucleic acid-binding protein
MQISLDTNVWIFGLLKSNEFCQKILLNLSSFNIVVPNQVRIELVRNLPDSYMKEFYQLVNESGAELDYEQVPDVYITMFESKGLKKGDAIIGGFGEWRKVDKIVSDNRDFLRGLSAGHHFEVMSPQEFCEEFGL